MSFTVDVVDYVILSGSAQWSSGLTPAIEAMPDKEALIVGRRQEEHLANIKRCVDGVKALAESS